MRLLFCLSLTYMSSDVSLPSGEPSLDEMVKEARETLRRYEAGIRLHMAVGLISDPEFRRVGDYRDSNSGEPPNYASDVH